MFVMYRNINDLSPQRGRRSRALPWNLLAVGLCLVAGIGVALVVLLSPQPAETVVAGPGVTIRVRWESASPEEVEQRISVPVEECLSRIAEAVAIRTEARVGGFTAEVEFASGTEETAALNLVRDALAGANLPEDANRPEVEIPARPGDRTVLLSFSGGENERELLRGVRAVRDRLSRDPGVRRVEIIGAPREIVLVQADESSLARFDLSPDALLKTVRGGIAGSLHGDPGEALRQLVILERGETTVYLRDIARITMTWDEPTSAARDEAGPAVLIRVVCGAGAGTPLLRGEVAGLRKALPPGVQVQIRPVDERDDHLLFLHWRAPPEDRLHALPGLARRLAETDGVTRMIAWTSPAEESRALLRTDVPVGDIAPVLVELLTRLPGIVLLSSPDPARKTLTFDVHLEDGQAPAGMAEDLRNQLRSLDGVEFVSPGPAPAATEVRVVVDQERAAAMGITPAAVAGQVAFFTGGMEVGIVGGLPVVLRGGESLRDADDLDGIRIWSPSGRQVPLKALATVELAAPPAAIRRVSGRRVVTFSLVPSVGADREMVLANAREAVRKRK